MNRQAFDHIHSRLAPSPKATEELMQRAAALGEGDKTTAAPIINEKERQNMTNQNNYNTGKARVHSFGILAAVAAMALIIGTVVFFANKLPKVDTVDNIHNSPDTSAAAAKTDNANGENTETNADKLTQKAYEMLALLNEEIHSEDYIEIMGYSTLAESELFEKVRAGEYTEPTGIYELKLSGDRGYYFTAFGINLDSLSLSDELKDYITDKVNVSFANVLNNSRVGAEAVALTSVLTVSKLFDCEDLEESTGYIYTFENGMPVLINFVKGEDNAVSATASLILLDGEDTSSAEGLQNSINRAIDPAADLFTVTKVG